MTHHKKLSLLDDMVENINSATSEFPQEDKPGSGFWHMHLPTSASIDSEKTPLSVRKTCIQTLVHRADYLRKLKPNEGLSTRVVASISLPKLFDSQIIVFFGRSYYDSFFDRNSQFQRWIPLPKDRSLVKEWGLSLPGGFIEIGYQEFIRDTDYSHDGEMWFIGELESL